MSVEFVPVPERLVVRSLFGGLGDIAATGSAMSKPDNHQVDLTEPYLEGVGAVVVSNQDIVSVENLEDLAGKPFYLGTSDTYFKTLERINATLAGRGLPPAKAVGAGGFFNTEDILEFLDAGIIGFSIVESHMARLWAPVFKNVAVSDMLGVSGEGSISFAVRKNNPKLKESLNRFLKEHKIGTLLGNIYFRRYFSDASRLKNPLNAEDREKFSKYAPLFKKYGALYGFDWMLLAAVAYQESGLDPRKRSPAGAVGLMQVLPSTARDRRIGMTDIWDAETNVHAGTKYLALLRDSYFDDLENDHSARTRLALAAYNAGPANVMRARSLAFETGHDPDRWFGHVEYAALRTIGRETVRYVSNINKYYMAYSLSGTLDCLKNRQKQRLLGAP